MWSLRKIHLYCVALFSHRTWTLDSSLHRTWALDLNFLYYIALPIEVLPNVTWFTNLLANRKKRIMVGFGLFLDKFERMLISKSKLASESCYSGFIPLVQKYWNGMLAIISCIKYLCFTLCDWIFLRSTS